MKITKILSAVALVMCFANAGYFDDIKTDSEIMKKQIKEFEQIEKIIKTSEDGNTIRWANYDLSNELLPTTLKDLTKVDDKEGMLALIQILKAMDYSDSSIVSITAPYIVDNNAEKSFKILLENTDANLKDIEIYDEENDKIISIEKYINKYSKSKEIKALLAK